MHEPISLTPRAADATPIDIAAAFAALQDLLLSWPELEGHLRSVSQLACDVVPGTQCGITVHFGKQHASAGSDPAAELLERVQLRTHQGPGVDAARLATRIDVPDQEAEARWSEYSARALAHGVRSSVSFPLARGGENLGWLDLLTGDPQALAGSRTARAQAFAHQAAGSLELRLRIATRIAADRQLQEAVTSRAIIDQALGMIMATRKVSSREALHALRRTSQDSNVKVTELAAQLITSLSGRPPEEPRPLREL